MKLWRSSGTASSRSEATSARLHLLRPISSHWSLGFVAVFIDRLNRARWTRRMDPGYEIARRIMGTLAARNASAPDPIEYVCSIFALEKRLKRKAEKERKKTSPPWDLSLIQTSIYHFWDRFSPELSDFCSFALAQTCNFPEDYIARFIQRLDRAGWSQRMDPDYLVPNKVMTRLAASMAKKPSDEIEDDCFFPITPMELKMEADKRKEEAERRNIEFQLRKLQEYEANRARREKEKAEKAARKRASKEKKRIATEKNQTNRVGLKALGKK